MTSVSEAVKRVVENSDFAWKSLQAGVLNTTAYAKLIKSDVEALTKKPVSQPSVVMALLRYGRQIDNESTNSPAGENNSEKHQTVTPSKADILPAGQMSIELRGRMTTSSDVTFMIAQDDIVMALKQLNKRPLNTKPQ